VKLLLLPVYPATYVAEQGFNQALHMRNKYRNRLDMNKTGGNAMRLKMINLQFVLKTLADKHHRKIRISWNQLTQLLLGNKKHLFYKPFAFVLFCAK